MPTSSHTRYLTRYTVNDFCPVLKGAEKDIAVATQWEHAIREALQASEYILLLLTPRSVDRHWVLLETGAAWALEKEIIPALVHVSP